MEFNLAIEGQAGQGPNALSKIFGNVLIKYGYYVFISRSYGSFIRGGTNINYLAFSDSPIQSNSSKLDFLVLLKKESSLNTKNVAIIKADSQENMYFAGYLVKLFNIPFNLLEHELRSLSHFEENLKNSKLGYSHAKTKFSLKKLSNKLSSLDGAQGICLGAVNSGLDIYFAYPMTPATSLINELAEKQFKDNFFVFELENEISVINTAIGSSLTGAKAMVGTSGGGFDLMTEALSLAGMIQVPLVIYLAQRPGPATGVPTYTSQSDLNIALYSGHGEFLRMVLAPGDPLEAQELASHAFYFSQKYKLPVTLLSDKHLAESIYTLKDSPKLISSVKSAVLKRYTSYTHDKNAFPIEDSELIKKDLEERFEIKSSIQKDAQKLNMFKTYGNKNSKNLIIFWGSVKGAVLDASKSLNAKLLQILYLEPFPDIKKEIESAKNVLIIENNFTSQLSSLIAQKTGFIIPDKNKILKYDAHPFYSDELKQEIEKRLK